MYDPLKYFFDRKISIPKGMLEDCQPFPMPTRAYLENPDMGTTYAPARKMKVQKIPNRELWRDHLAISIGADLQGFVFHAHREAWNVVVHGSKRWILWDHDRWKNNSEIQKFMTRDPATNILLRSHEWIRTLYPHPERMEEIRTYGHDCVQRAGDMLYIPEKWLHMVVNIGDTVAIISEIGLGGGQGRTEEDFQDSEDEDDSEDWDSDDEDGSEDDEDSEDEDDSEDE